MKIDFLNLQRQYGEIQNEVELEVVQCLRKGDYVEGTKVKELEQEMIKYLGVKHVITCANGTDALIIALRASGVKPGDEVITTPFTFFATAEAIMSMGAIPIFVDVNREDYNIDVDKIEAKITEKTTAILAVHIFGAPADMERISAIARKHNIRVIEDSAQAIGSELHGKKAGTMSEAGCFSFYPTKNLGAFGDAGMLVTNSDDVAVVARALKSHAAGKIGAQAYEVLNEKPVHVETASAEANILYDPYKYFNYLIGGNSRLDNIQAAVLLVKMRKLESYNANRARIALNYSRALSTLPIRIPTYNEQGKSCWHQYAIMVEEKEKLVEFLSEKGIATGAFYPVPLHLQAVFEKLGGRPGDLPIAEELCRQSVCLPIFPELYEEEQEYIISSIQEYYKK